MIIMIDARDAFPSSLGLAESVSAQIKLPNLYAGFDIFALALPLSHYYVVMQT